MKALKNFISIFLISSVLTITGAAGTSSDQWQKEPQPRKPPERPRETDKREEPKRDEKRKPNNYF